MNDLSAINFGRIMALTSSLLSSEHSLADVGLSAFVARGREGRSEFHVDPSDEVNVHDQR